MAFDDDDYSDKPVEEGKTYEVEIEDLGSKGDGIARVDGFVVFVSDTEVGERVAVEINSVGSKFAFGDVVERLGTVEDPGETPAEPVEVESDDDPADDPDEPEADEDVDDEPDDGMGSIDDQFGDGIEEL